MILEFKGSPMVGHFGFVSLTKVKTCLAILASTLKLVMSKSSVDNKHDLKHILQKLKNRLDQNMLFLVLVDVSMEKRTEWLELEYCLLKIAPIGSKLMMTTRSKVIATTVRSKNI